MRKNLIFTLGVAMFEGNPDALDATIELVAPDILIDARYSRAGARMKGMGGLQIASRFPEIYEWRGQSGLGGIRAENTTAAGLDRLVKDAHDKTILLFCHCHDAVHKDGMACHRHSDIAVKLHDRVNFAHIQWADKTKRQLWWVSSFEIEKYRQHIAAGGKPEAFQVQRFLFPEEMPIESDFS